jgi:hypothetical protein
VSFLFALSSAHTVRSRMCTGTGNISGDIFQIASHGVASEVDGQPRVESSGILFSNVCGSCGMAFDRAALVRAFTRTKRFKEATHRRPLSVAIRAKDGG